MSRKDDSINTSGGGIGFCGLLTLIFVTLKVSNQIDWDWLWVLSPLWIPVVVVFGIALVMLILIIIGGMFGND